MICAKNYKTVSKVLWPLFSRTVYSRHCKEVCYFYLPSSVHIEINVKMFQLSILGLIIL